MALLLDNHNASNGLGEILDHVKNTLRIPWNRGNLMETGFLEERGWIPLETEKKSRGTPKSLMSRPLSTVG
jgi:hypothetical protein